MQKVDAQRVAMMSHQRRTNLQHARLFCNESSTKMDMRGSGAGCMHNMVAFLRHRDRSDLQHRTSQTDVFDDICAQDILRQH